MTVTLESLMLQVGRRLGNARNPGATEGFITDITSTTLQFNDTVRLFEVDQHWSGGFAAFMDGPNVWAPDPGNTNTEARISTYTRSAGVTLHSATPTNMAVGDHFQIFKVMPSRVAQAINNALSGAFPDVRDEVVDESLKVTSNIFSYTIPASITNVLHVELQWDTGIPTYPYQRLKRSDWDVRVDRTSGVVRTLQFTRQPPVIGNAIRLIGESPIGALTGIASTVPYDVGDSEVDIVIHDAVRRLLDEDVRAAGYMSVDAVESLAKIASGRYDDAIAKHGQPRRPLQFRSPNVRPGI